MVEHAGTTRVIDCAAAEGWRGLSYAALYADCRHEVRQVRSGYRVALTVNVYQDISGGHQWEGGTGRGMGTQHRQMFRCVAGRHDGCGGGGEGGGGGEEEKEKEKEKEKEEEKEKKKKEEKEKKKKEEKEKEEEEEEQEEESKRGGR